MPSIFRECQYVTALVCSGGGVQNVNMATLSAVPASKVVCSGDALKSCTMGQENQANIDVQLAGPGLSQSCLLRSCFFVTYLFVNRTESLNIFTKHTHTVV